MLLCLWLLQWLLLFMLLLFLLLLELLLCLLELPGPQPLRESTRQKSKRERERERQRGVSENIKYQILKPSQVLAVRVICHPRMQSCQSQPLAPQSPRTLLQPHQPVTPLSRHLTFLKYIMHVNAL